MALGSPSGGHFLDQLLGEVGGNAEIGINRRNIPGRKQMGQMFNQFENAPPTALPGGGTLDPSRTSMMAREMEPSAELPLYQNARANRIGFADVLGRTSELGTSEEMLNQRFRATLAAQLQNLLYELGMQPGPASGVSGASGMLMKLMSGGY
jgi:hypothetical protein